MKCIYVMNYYRVDQGWVSESRKPIYDMKVSYNRRKHVVNTFMTSYTVVNNHKPS